MQLRVQKESRRDYIRSTIGQARAHGPCLYMFDKPDFSNEMGSMVLEA
jgi:hypothetical protein